MREYGEEFANDIAKQAEGQFTYLVASKDGAARNLEELIDEDFAIAREVPGEEERRYTFFSRWQSEKGSEANYKNLINALLMINDKQDAEYVRDLVPRITTASKTTHQGPGIATHVF